MSVESGVFSCHSCIDQIRREFLIADISSVLYMESRQDLSIFGYDLGSKLAVRVLEIFKRRDVGKGPYRKDKQHDRSHSGSEENPEPHHYLLFRRVCHICKNNVFIYKLSPLGDALLQGVSNSQN